MLGIAPQNQNTPLYPGSSVAVPALNPLKGNPTAATLANENLQGNGPDAGFLVGEEIDRLHLTLERLV